MVTSSDIKSLTKNLSTVDQRIENYFDGTQCSESNIYQSPDDKSDVICLPGHVSISEEKQKSSQSPFLTPTIASLQVALPEYFVDGADDVKPPALKGLPMHRTKSSSDLYEDARRFSALSVPETITKFCIAKDKLSSEDLLVDQILSGLSNQLFKVNLRQDLEDRKYLPYVTVLFRIYGKDVDTLYDSSTEVKVFKKLGEIGIAPELISEFSVGIRLVILFDQGGRIEGWIEGSALLVTDMGKSNVMMGASAIIAGIHQVDLSSHIDTEPCIIKYLNKWRTNAMKIYDSVGANHPSYLAYQRLRLPEFFKESFKLNDYLLSSKFKPNILTQLAFCHNDIQENNIMVTSTCMRLIDYEYSGYNYPAYDIASYFWEMTCDYCVDNHSKYPSLEKRRLFVAMYLTKLKNEFVKATDHAIIDPLVDAVERYQLACHMLWAFWAIIRAPQAATATSFDMLFYCQKRIDAYWTQKAKLLSEDKLS